MAEAREAAAVKAAVLLGPAVEGDIVDGRWAEECSMSRKVDSKSATRHYYLIGTIVEYRE